jgi:hypothetical protein
MGIKPFCTVIERLHAIFCFYSDASTRGKQKSSRGPVPLFLALTVYGAVCLFHTDR